MAVSEAKEIYAARMNRLLDSYSKVLFCNLDNVRSQQLHDVRASLRGKGELLVGKKTLQKKILSIRATADGASSVDKALYDKLCTQNMLIGNLGLLFTNASVASIQEELSKHRIQAPARVGAVAPCDVIVPAGNTGLEPTMTGFFQALNIQTKIAKGTVEITTDKKVLSTGDKVDNSTAALLQKLKISPFWYSAEVVFFWDSGLMFTAEDLSVTPDVMNTHMQDAISNLTALSLGSGILTEASFPHAIMDGFKNLLAASVATDYSFDEYNGAKLIADIKSGKCAAAAAPAAAAAAAPAASGKAAAAAAPAEEEEEEDFGLGLF